MRNRNHGFDVTVLWDDGASDDYRELRIVGEISQYHPAVYHLPNGDPGYPAEGGEIEHYTIFENGKELEDPDGRILEAVMDEVYEKASEDAASDQEDAREHARECLEDR